MKFYRPLRDIKAITFDLDDTLYDNYPVIRKTTEASHAALQAFHPALRAITPEDVAASRSQLRASEPEIYHDVDVSEWRRRSVEHVMCQAGLTPSEAAEGATQVMDVFHQWRSQVDMPAETHDTLNALAKKVPLVAITNGNAQPEKLGLAHYFQFSLRAGPDGRAKPWLDMYRGWICISWPRNVLISPRNTFCTLATISPPMWQARFVLACRPAGLTFVRVISCRSRMPVCCHTLKFPSWHHSPRCYNGCKFIQSYASHFLTYWCLWTFLNCSTV